MRTAVISAILTLAMCSPFVGLAQQTASAIDPKIAKQFFNEMKAVSDGDAGRLWGVRLYGPTMFADPRTHQVVTNQADKEGRLRAQDDVFVGQLPAEMAIANTGVDWAGVRWTMLMWPLPQSRRPRKQLMAHESFHRIQPRLGLAPLDSSNNHLDGRVGRTWLQVEWRALTKALATSGAARRETIADALYFRALRRALIPNAAANENRLEANEGLAEYTGVKLSARYPQEARLVAEVILWQGPNRSPFVRSFAYVSGPAYGMLLDSSGVPWRGRLKSDSDLGTLLAQAYHVPSPLPNLTDAARPGCGKNEYLCCDRCLKKTEACTVSCMAIGPTRREAEAISRARKYDGDEIIAQEKERELRQQKLIGEQRRRLIENPVLVLPLGPRVNYGFDPDEVTAIDDQTSVFGGNVQVTDAWGVLTTTGGVLLVRDNGKLVRGQVPAPANPSGTLIIGEGWRLELKPGWKLMPGPRPKDWIAESEQQ